MLLRLVVSLVAALLFAGPADADVTITNFTGGGTAITNQISHRDQAGSALRAKDGFLFQDPNAGPYPFYFYGTDYACGYAWEAGVTRPSCGFRVYGLPDGNPANAVDLGPMFDATTTFWQDRCSSKDTGHGNGCFKSNMVYNAKNNNYVFLFNQTCFNTCIAAVNGIFVFTCPLPYPTVAQPCTKQADPTGLSHPRANDLKVFVDDDAKAYAVYDSSGTGPFNVYVDLLNSDYLDSTGTNGATGTNLDGLSMLKHAGTYFVFYGAPCGFCLGGTDTTYVSASSPLGPYSNTKTISAKSGLGQNQGTYHLTVAGQDTYLQIADQWYGGSNEGLSNLYFQNLTFTGSTIDAYTTSATATIFGATPVSPTILPGHDQINVSDQFYDTCEIGSLTWRTQVFTPSVASLASFAVPLGQNNPGLCVPGHAGCPGLDGNVTVSLVNVNQSTNVPGSVIDSFTIVPTTPDPPWATLWRTFLSSQTLTPGTKYGISIAGSGSNGCVAVPISEASNPYGGGVLMKTTNAGSSWAVETGKSMMFATFPPAPVFSGPGRMWMR